MTKSELSRRNYKRISIINWLLCVPILLLFAFPYIKIAGFLNIEKIIVYPGALLFSLPFMLTILHGHVTMALGSVHRHHYYRWLEENTLTYGLFFHPIFTRTRFRLILVISSGILLVIGWVVKF